MNYNPSKKTDDGNSKHYASLGNSLTNHFKSGIEYAKNSRVGKFLYNNDINQFSLFHPQIEGEALKEMKEGIKSKTRGIYHSFKAAPGNLKDPSWWKSHKHELIPIMMPLALDIAACSLVGLAYTRYDNALRGMANTKLHGMPKTIGEYWSQGQMPVQLTPTNNGNIINLGHTSLNPVAYSGPSIKVISKDPLGTPISQVFSTRPLTLAESNIINEFNSGAFTGTEEYSVIAAANVTYAAGCAAGYSASKHVKKDV